MIAKKQTLILGLEDNPELTIEHEDWGAVRFTVPAGVNSFVLPPDVLREIADNCDEYRRSRYGMHPGLHGNRPPGRG